MKSRIITFLFSLILVASFSGCGGGSDDGGGSTSSGGTTPVISSASISASTTTITLVNGNNKVVIVDARSSSGAVEGIVAQSSNTAVFTVDTSSSPTLVVESKAVGSATLNILSDSGKTLSIPVTITAPIASNTIIPQNISASDGTYVDKIVVTWDAVVGADSYYIYKDDLLYSIGALNSFEDTSVNTTKTYSYTVKASVSGTLSDISSADTGYISGYNAGGGNTNTPPTVINITDQSRDVNVVMNTIVISATDTEGDTLSYTATGLPTGVSIDNATGIISGTPVAVGSYSVTVTVNDGSLNTSIGFTLTINNVSNYIATLFEADDKNVADEFGERISLSGNYAVVGARYEGTNGTRAGAAYIFKNSGGTFTQLAKLIGNDTDGYDNFGECVVVDGNYVAIGADVASGKTEATAGAAYIYKNAGNDTYTQIAKIFADDGGGYDGFGSSIDMDGSYIAVGSSEAYNHGSQKGAAYIFMNDGNDSFSQVAKLSASNAQEYDNFGNAIAIDGNYVVVGSQHTDTNGSETGTVYIYKNDGSNNFSEIAILHASDADRDDNFGNSVAINGNYIVIGAYQKDGTDSGAGAVYVFKNSADSFTQIAKLTESTSSDYDSFGSSVDVSVNGKTIVVGAANVDNPADITPKNRGALYVFTNDGNDNFIQSEKIIGDTTYSLGTSVSIDGSVVIAGAPGSDSNGDEVYAYTFNNITTPTLSVDTTSVTLDVDAIALINVLATTDGTTTESVNVSSTDNTIATVSVSGNQVTVTGVSAGNTEITIVSSSGVIKTVNVSVNALVVSNEGSVSSPVSLTVGTSHNAQIGDSADSVESYSYYSFRTADAGVYSYLINYTGVSVDLDIMLYANANFVSDYIGAYYNDTSGDFATLDANKTYYMKVINSSSSDITFAITINAPTPPANTVPTVATISDISVDENVAMPAVSVDAVDAEGDSLSYSATGLPSGVSIDSTTGIISGTPTTAGLYNVTVTVDDGNLSASKSFLYNVNVVVTTSFATIQMLPSDGNSSDHFGRDVDLSGAFAIAGSAENGDEGAAFIFKNGTELIKLVGDDSVSGDYFGMSVAVDGNLAAVGSPYATVGASAKAGSAYVFQYNGTTFTQIVKLTADDYNYGDYFGSKIDIHNDIIAVGAREGNNNIGAVYVFRNSSGNITQIAKLVPPTGADYDNFSSAIAVYGDYIAVGAIGYDDVENNAGRVYVYRKDVNYVYSLVDTLYLADGKTSFFGYSLSMNSNYLVVGATEDSSAAYSAGAVYVYKNDGSDNFLEVEKIIKSNASMYDYLGHSVAISSDGQYLAAGMYKEAVDGNSSAGSVYLYHNDGQDNFLKISELNASQPGEYHEVGYCIAMDDNNILAGAPGITETPANYVGELYLFNYNSSSSATIKDGTPTSPVAITLDVPYRGKAIVFGSQDDMSYYSFTTTGAGDYTISTSAYSEETDLNLGVYTTTAYDMEVSSSGNDANLTRESITVTLAADTTYYLKVSDFNVAVSFDLLVATPTDTNIALVSGVSVTGEILNEGDVIWYSFDGVAGNDYNILSEDTDNASSSYSGDITVSVYKADGTTFYEYYFSVGGSTQGAFDAKDIFDEDGLFIHTDGSEKVLVKVQGYDTSSTGTYSLKITKQ